VSTPKRHEDLRIPTTPEKLAKAVARSLNPPMPKPKPLSRPRAQGAHQPRQPE